MYNFKGKVALVIGAARKRSIGYATAVRFAREGADVVVTSRYRPPEKFPEEEKLEGWKGLDSVVEEIESHNVRALAITADITQKEEVHNMVEKTLATFGRIDFLVCTAGALNRDALIELEEDDWRRVMAVNLDGVFYSCKAVARHMLERDGGGVIVNVSSRLGKIGVKNRGAYCASKFAVCGLTQVLAIELAPHDVRVNAICPGRFITNMAAGTEVWKLAQEKGISTMEAANLISAETVELTPMKRVGYPEEAAKAILFLCSDEASFITGQSINVDGGRLTAH